MVEVLLLAQVLYKQLEQVRRKEVETGLQQGAEWPLEGVCKPGQLWLLVVVLAAGV